MAQVISSESEEPAPHEPLRLDHPSGKFDLVLVWDHWDFVPPDHIEEFGSELHRVLGDQGLALLFSLNSQVKGEPRFDAPNRYRVLEDGPNPDIEVGTYLAAAGFANVPRVLGSAEVAEAGNEATLAMVQAFVSHEGNLWETMREAVGAFLHDVEAEAEPPEVAGDGDHFFLELISI